MRTTLLITMLAGTAALGACDSVRDAFSARPDLVASVEGERLSTDRMVGLMNAVPNGTVTQEGAEYVAGLWVDLHLFARARIDGRLAPDSATVARVLWPRVVQSLLGTWHDSLVASRAKPTEATADSAFETGDARLFQHIIIMPAGITPADTAAAERKIGGMLARIRAGRAFTDFTPENNDMTKDDDGFLPVGPRGQFVPEFEDVAWALQPGDVSEVVKSPFGWHIIRRTPKDEALPRFLTWLETAGQAAQDSVYLARLSEAKGLQMASGAVEAVRKATEDREAARRSRHRLATYRGGAFTVADFMHWMEAFPPSAMFQITQQPDTNIVEFLQSLAQNTLILAQIDSAGLSVPEAEWQALTLAYRAQMDQLAAGMALNDSVVTDTLRPMPERMDSAASRVERFMDRLVAGQAQFAPLPAALSSLLRDGSSYRVNRAGLARALELHQAQKVADSAAAAAAQPAQPPATGGVIQPAPGPAPVPGGSPPPP